LLRLFKFFSLRSIHYITIAAALGLLALIYFGGNTNPPKPREAAAQAGMSGRGPMQGAGQAPVRQEASFDSILASAQKALPQHALGELHAVEKDFTQLHDSVKMAPLFTHYAQIWQEHKQFPVAAYYYSLAAKLESSEKKLTFAAQLFLELGRKEHSATVQTWEINNAIHCFDELLKVNPNNDTAKVGLAECYFGTGEAMKGVVLLKDIIQKYPEHIPANLMLGQQGLVSGQFDKAQQRFQNVLKNDPKNMEAMLGLAEAYKGLGQNQKALELLEKCKKAINNPDFSKDVDNYIKTFK